MVVLECLLEAHNWCCKWFRNDVFLRLLTLPSVANGKLLRKFGKSGKSSELRLVGSVAH